jgi:thiol-disulfide isomerase/thioredoxin
MDLNLKDSIISSFNHSSLANSDIVIDFYDEKNYCPFCEKEVIPYSNEGAFFKLCSCEESKQNREKKLDTLQKIEKLKKELRQEEMRIEDIMLKKYKSLFHSHLQEKIDRISAFEEVIEKLNVEDLYIQCQ